MKRVIGLVLTCLLAASACADTGSIDEAGPSTRGGDLPVTPRAIAAVAADHTGDPSSATEDFDAAEEFKPAGIGAELRYGSDGEYDGDALVVAVGRRLREPMADCDNVADYLSGCAEVDGAVLFWEKVAPEEDPGVVYLVYPKADATVLMFYSGPDITGDPQDLAMPISVDDLVAIAKDPRIDLTTSQSAIDEGEALDLWS